MGINYQKVMQKMGWSASDTSSYQMIEQTWDSESSGRRCPSEKFFKNLWNDMVMSGEETGDWKQERQKSYENQGLHIDLINELIMEHYVAITAGDLTGAEKYQTLLEEVHVKRQAIKDANPKP